MEPKHTIDPTSSVVDIARGKPVPWIIIAFFISFIIPLVGFTWIAFQHKPDVVTEHAYDKGLAYNRTLQAEAAMEALGWHTKLSFENHTLTLQLTDKDGKPIHGATAKAWVIRPAEARLDQSAAMRETKQGHYEASIPNAIPGLWQMRITMEYQGKQFQAAHDFLVK